jgi:phage baseplate assembly protein W
MADGTTYGLFFPFQDSRKGDYLALTEYDTQEIRSDLIHLLLTRKGTRYFLPEFGTRLYEYIFEPFDGLTFSAIESDIRDSINRFMPNLIVNNISIEPITQDEEFDGSTKDNTVGSASLWDIYRVPGKNTYEYTAKVRIDYSTGNSVFSQSDFVIINI